MRCGPARTVAARGGTHAAGPGPSRITIDRERYLVTGDGLPVQLTLKTYRLLTTLADAGGRVVTRADLYRAVWGEVPTFDARTLDVHVAMLRRALGAAAVRTVVGVGYAIGEAT